MGKHMPVIYEGWNDWLKNKARGELKEDEISTADEIRQLKMKIKDKNLCCCTDDDFLVWFLRCKKHNVQRSFEQLSKYSDRRYSIMHMYEHMFFERTRVAIEEGICGILPKRDAEGRVIIYIRVGAWQPDCCNFEDIVRTVQSLGHFVMQYPATQVNGFGIIFETDFVSFNCMILAMDYIQKHGPALSAFPGRFQKIAVVNTSLAVRSVANAVLAVLPAKVRQRTSFYGDPKTNLPKIFHPNILPEEYGGTMGPLKSLYDTWLPAYRDYLPKLHATNKFYRRG